jgi:hypothetical protein
VPKPSFHCEREVHFTAHCRSSRLAGDRSPLTQNESVPKATNIEVNGKRKAADPEKVGWTLDRKPRLFALRGAGCGRRAAQVLLHLGRRQRASGARAGNVDQVIEAQPP